MHLHVGNSRMLKSVLKLLKYNIFKFLIEKFDILFKTYIFHRYFYKEHVLKLFFLTSICNIYFQKLNI